MFLSDALEILGLRSPILRLGLSQSKSGEINPQMMSWIVGEVSS